MASPRIRHALITGGSRGIGLAIAQAFAKNHYRCTLISRSQESLDSAISTLPSSHLPASTSHGCIAGDISKAAFWTSKGFGARLEPPTDVDVFVNCAGITQNSFLLRTPPDRIAAVVDTNLTGMMLGTRYLLRKELIARGIKEDGPVIINVASLLGVQGGRGAVAYAASKAGVLGFTRALADELRSSHVRVNAIVPGYISTDMTAGMEGSENLLKKIPVGRFGKPEEVADAALFLVRNQYANNCVINLDGGLSIFQEIPRDLDAGHDTSANAGKVLMLPNPKGKAETDANDADECN